MNDLLERFERREIEASSFAHYDHVHVAYEMLAKYEFMDACARYARTIKAMAESVGVPQKFNATITLAFLSLIAERRSQASQQDFDTFWRRIPTSSTRRCSSPGTRTND